MPGPVFLRPTADLAERVLLTGDPGRALMLAQAVTSTPKMFNHHRGLWGYTGAGDDDRPLTVQASGIGGTSAAAVVEDLAGLGARRIVRVGSATSLAEDVRPGDLVIVDDAIGDDPAGNAAVRPDPTLRAALRAASGDGVHTGRVLSMRYFAPPAAAPAGSGARVTDLQTAAVLGTAARLGIRAACVLVVAGARTGERLDDDALEAAATQAGRLAAGALAGDGD